MSKAIKKRSISMSEEKTLFDEGMSEGALDVRMLFRDTLTREILKSRLDRWRFAADVSRLSRHELSKDMLDKCTSSNFDYGLRAESLPAVLYVLQSLEPARALLASIGSEVIAPEESEFVRLLRLERESTRLNDQISGLRAKLGIRK